ncbi:MAG TPA: hypothetical protein DCK99_02060 [Blastocatellia bacterium]|nr:hypothetical protein [Blastocatellia bacterium]
MKRELLKGFTMLAMIIALALATAAVSNAQSTNKITADIPFDFVVADRAMPAGEYSVRANSSQGDLLMVQSQDSRSSAIRWSNSLGPNKDKTHARLVFHRYGERYFLAEVWYGADSTGRQLLKSRQERAIERELASISSRSEQARSTYEVVEVTASLR